MEKMKLTQFAVQKNPGISKLLSNTPSSYPSRKQSSHNALIECLVVFVEEVFATLHHVGRVRSQRFNLGNNQHEKDCENFRRAHEHVNGCIRVVLWNVCHG